jgi:predicted ATPase
MIKSISLQNFKCYKEETKFPLSKLNLFTGLNGKGKSTVLQALLLMKQSIEKNDSTTELYLSGEYVDLNSYQEVKNKYSGENEISISIETELESYTYKLGKSIKNGQDTLHIVSVNEQIIDGKKYSLLQLFPYSTSDEYYKHFLGFNNPYKHISYISASRINPENSYQSKSLKPTGGHTLKPPVDGFFWVKKVSEHLQEIFEEEISVEVTDYDNDPIIVRFYLNGKKYLPTNIGFGYSYILPILIAGETAEEGDILIIENPEAHLHPKAQANLAKFLSKVANKGVQILLESHSDHILNALRVSVNQKNLAPEDVNIFFFTNQENDTQPKIFMLEMDEYGGIFEWPKGFFDQTEIDIKILLDLK